MSRASLDITATGPLGCIIPLLQGVMTTFRRGTPAFILFVLSVRYRPLSSSTRSEPPTPNSPNSGSALSSAPKTGDKGSGAAGARESFGDGPWTPLCEHMALRGGPQEQQRGQPHDCRPDADYQVLIATVPDPEQTHLALDFDRYVESIAWAVADSDFSLENHWFPWQPITSKQETDPKTREEARRDRETRLKSPGILLF